MRSIATLVPVHGSDIDHCPALYLRSSSLRAVLFFQQYPWNRKANKNLLRYSKFLRVLSVDVEEDKHIPRSLLTEISNLRQLTYLKLGCPEMTWMTLQLPYAITNLKSLLTLDLQEFRAVYLPNAIWSMKQLRHILLPLRCFSPSFYGVNLDVFHPTEISLPNLQTLHWLPADIFKVEWLHKLTSLRTLRVNLEDKDIIGVLSGAAPVLDMQETVSLNFSRYCNLSELFIENVRLKELPHYKLPPNLTTLGLVRTHLMMDIAEALKNLQKLKFLKLDSYSYVGKELIFSGELGSFARLEVLDIEYLPQLERVVVEERGMPRLREFRILSPETQVPDIVRSVMRTTE